MEFAYLGCIIILVVCIASRVAITVHIWGFLFEELKCYF